MGNSEKLAFVIVTSLLVLLLGFIVVRAATSSDTGEVGCAIARGRVEDVLVCRYSDAGNYIGERPF